MLDTALPTPNRTGSVGCAPGPDREDDVIEISTHASFNDFHPINQRVRISQALGATVSPKNIRILGQANITSVDEDGRKSSAVFTGGGALFGVGSHLTLTPQFGLGREDFAGEPA